MTQLRYRACFSFLLGLACIAPVEIWGADEPAKPSGRPNRGMQMDTGPFLCYSVLKPRPATQPTTKSPTAKPAKPKSKEGDPNYPWKPEEMLATKGISVRLDKTTTVVFDTDTCRYAGGWTGGFLDVTKCNFGLDKGTLPAIALGALYFTTSDSPGWAKDGSFKDPRSDRRGPLPRDWARFKGIYRDGEHLVFSYTVGDANVLDEPRSLSIVGPSGMVSEGFTRTIRVDHTLTPVELVVCDSGKPTFFGDGTLETSDSTGTRRFGLVGAPSDTFLVFQDGQIRVRLSRVVQPIVFKIVVAASLPAGERVADEAPPQDPSQHTHGGPPLWKEPLVTTGTLGSDKEPYAVDTIKVPDQNPWLSWMRLSALDFFSDGRAAICTWNGDVWVVSNIDAKLEKVTWKRFAAGLYEPLGLKIVDDVIYVNCRDGLYRLHDLNNDGEADFYECFNNDAVCSGNYHAFEFDLQTDRAGNFYYAVCGNGEALATKDHGCILKVSKDGSKLETFASGLRAPNGMSIGPNDEIVIGDNQGHWTPSSKINWVKQGGFYGFQGDPRKLTKADVEYMAGMHPSYDPPLCWIPYAWDNSSGGQLWAGTKWGPLSGQMLHLSYGKCTMLEVISENVDGVMQGGVVQLPLKFESGVMRGRVNPMDGQVYVVGLKGWQSSAGKAGCFQRVRYTGQPVHLPNELHITEKGIVIGFTSPLDPETANDPDSYGVEQFVYRWSSTYGSPELKASNPAEKGHDVIPIKSAKLLPDKRSVLLEIPGLKPVDQMIIKINVDAADGAKIKCEIGNTINKVGK